MIATNSGNKYVAIAISQWVFKEHGELRVKSVKHHKEGEKVAPKDYTIMDNVVGNICKFHRNLTFSSFNKLCTYCILTFVFSFCNDPQLIQHEYEISVIIICYNFQHGFLSQNCFGVPYFLYGEKAQSAQNRIITTNLLVV